MTLSRLEHSLLLAQRGPLLKPDGEGGGNGSESSAQNANSSGTSEGAEAQQGTGGESESKSEPVTIVHEGKQWVLQSHVNHLVGTARQEGKSAAESEAKRLADEAAARAKGDFEKLANDRQAQIEALQAQLAQRDHDDLRRTVATRHKLPAELASRLSGETEAELEADAKALLKVIEPRKAPDTEAGAGVGTSNGTSDKPIRKTGKESEKQPAYTFDGRPKVAWPNR